MPKSLRTQVAQLARDYQMTEQDAAILWKVVAQAEKKAAKRG